MVNDTLKQTSSDSGKRHLRSKSRGKSVPPTTYIFDFDLLQNNVDFDQPFVVGLKIPDEKKSLKDQSLKFQPSSISSSSSSSGSSVASGESESVPSSIQTPVSPADPLPQASVQENRNNQRVEFKIFSYAGISTGRRHTPDPLVNATFEPFHKHMERVEKRARQQERERSVNEHEKLKQLKHDLTGPLWRSILPTVTKINNLKDKVEMETKCKKTINEINFFMDRYTKYRQLEKKMQLHSVVSYDDDEHASVGNISNRRDKVENIRNETKKQKIQNTPKRRSVGDFVSETKGVVHNTYDPKEPGVDYVSSEDEEDPNAPGQWEWVYDGYGAGIRANQR
ncbi:uncharacterized protein SAPINGB_P001795 [Magnusiomyces paraingens]|uniref:Something about silencing protein 4 domain-containing protein n=1 Tax=Magnusiomyces paraingens TaxID=2606893 RepID=A0A5E8BIA3_9ASCO|nr:uncharacterized protein SAPINGB_P001795 [Saprochaete ingens]VVT48470.1 unnamed protein product [Saprochaete ingens]